MSACGVLNTSVHARAACAKLQRQWAASSDNFGLHHVSGASVRGIMGTFFAMCSCILEASYLST